MNIFQKEVIYFLVLSDTLNISKAAEALGVLQPALSRSLRRLENELGLKLFIRKNSGLALTLQGRHFLSSLQNTKNMWEENMKSLLLVSENPAGVLKIGAQSSMGRKYLPQIIGLVTNLFPQIEMEIHTLPSLQVARQVSQNEIDFGIVASTLKQPEIVAREIGDDFLGIYQAQPEMHRTHVLFNPETQMLNSILKKMNKLKSIIIKDYEIIAQTALRTNHLALLPSSVTEIYPGLQLTGAPLVKNKISFICHKDKLRSPAFKKIWDEILQAF